MYRQPMSHYCRLQQMHQPIVNKLLNPYFIHSVTLLITHILTERLRCWWARAVIRIPWSFVTPPYRERCSSPITCRTKHRKRQDEHDQQTPTIKSRRYQVTVFPKDPGFVDPQVCLNKDRDQESRKHGTGLRRNDRQVAGKDEDEGYVDRTEFEFTNSRYEMSDTSVDEDDSDSEPKTDGDDEIVPVQLKHVSGQRPSGSGGVLRLEEGA